MKSRDRRAFRAPDETIGSLNVYQAASLAQAAGDVAFVIDSTGRIVDVAFTEGDPTGGSAEGWVGCAWVDTVTPDSRNKINELVAAAAAGEPPRWRQVNHPSANGDVPVRYLAVPSGASGRFIAVGRDLSALAAVQQRLIQTQQSLERDYLRLRQTESRYKMLFDLGGEPVMVIDAATRRIREANPAAIAAISAKPGTMLNRPFSSVIDPVDHDNVIAHFGMVAAADHVAPLTVKLDGSETRAALSATAFRQDRALFFLVRLSPVEAVIGRATGAAQMLDVIDRLPDAFVVAGPSREIISANAAFLELSGEVSLTRLHGAPLSDYLGRAGVDAELIFDQLNEHGVIRNVATVMRTRGGAIEQVEVSAVSAPAAAGLCYGFSIRSVSRRVRDLPPAERGLPRSVEQLTELVGRMSLKDIVRESTDLIERLCIEAALDHTSDNRASAAEILGVSRQSLYSKLHRHGLGNLVSGIS